MNEMFRSIQRQSRCGCQRNRHARGIQLMQVINAASECHEPMMPAATRGIICMTYSCLLNSAIDFNRVSDIK